MEGYKRTARIEPKSALFFPEAACFSGQSDSTELPRRKKGKGTSKRRGEAGLEQTSNTTTPTAALASPLQPFSSSSKVKKKRKLFSHALQSSPVSFASPLHLFLQPLALKF